MSPTVRRSAVQGASNGANAGTQSGHGPGSSTTTRWPCPRRIAIAASTARSNWSPGHGADWTVYLNWIHGGDPWPFVTHVAHRLRTRWLVGSFQPATTPGHAPAKLEIGGPDGRPPLNQVRTIEARDEDGRWSWHATGRVMPFEQAGIYRIRRVRRLAQAR